MCIRDRVSTQSTWGQLARNFKMKLIWISLLICAIFVAAIVDAKAVKQAKKTLKHKAHSARHAFTPKSVKSDLHKVPVSFSKAVASHVRAVKPTPSPVSNRRVDPSVPELTIRRFFNAKRRFEKVNEDSETLCPTFYPMPDIQIDAKDPMNVCCKEICNVIKNTDEKNIYKCEDACLLQYYICKNDLVDDGQCSFFFLTPSEDPEEECEVVETTNACYKSPLSAAPTDSASRHRQKVLNKLLNKMAQKNKSSQRTQPSPNSFSLYQHTTPTPYTSQTSIHSFKYAYAGA
eukprot:TRINITY_DN4778_c0_g1_i5.p1 TRINITY_DN4778_c0_g1~~TRINITY_DN4778_c0_g1_i5.p1  ORF type:complete len:309 (-),score=107.75 TRINITY_DN4778_c0_g1_i5:299-1165(-)